MKQVSYALGSIAVGVWLNFTPHHFIKTADVVFQNDTIKDVHYIIERDTINHKLTFVFPTIEHEK